MLSIVAVPAISGAARDETRILVFTKTTGFRHASIEPAIAAIRKLGRQHDFRVAATEDPSVFSLPSLRRYAAVVFVSTTGNPITDAGQQSALRDYVEHGGGFVGVHAASDQDATSQATWPWLGELIGAYFGGHPLYRARPTGDESCAVGDVVSCHTGVVHIEDRRHPATRSVVTATRGRTWDVYDEFYGFSTNPRPQVHVLATLDEGSYLDDPNRLELGPGAMGADHPIAWCHRVGRGRSFYTGLGHDSALFADRAYLSHLLGGIQWAAGRASGQGCAKDGAPSTSNARSSR
jgi:type 1 glutamine amidotransferase